MGSQDVTTIPGAGVCAEQELGQVDLGDKTLDRRAVELGARMARLPGASLPQQMRGSARLKAAYRFLDNGSVSRELLGQPHWQTPRQQAAEESVVLMVQDVAHLGYRRYASTMAELAPIGDGRGAGLMLHTTLAVKPKPRQVLEVPHQQVFKRKGHGGQPRRKRPKAERESRVWGEAAQAIGRPAEGTRSVVVADRAADNTDFLLTCRDRGLGYNVRLSYESRTAVEGNRKAGLFALVRS